MVSSILFEIEIHWEYILGTWKDQLKIYLNRPKTDKIFWYPERPWRYFAPSSRIFSESSIYQDMESERVGRSMHHFTWEILIEPEEV